MYIKKIVQWVVCLVSIIYFSIAVTSASDHGLKVVSEYANSAIRKGYGVKCSLEMKPVKRGGYYPCLDFGPYRYVVEYQKISGYVVQKNMPPYKIFQGAAGNIDFIVDGPWRQDVPVQMLSWWNAVVNGGAIREKELSQADSRKKAAEEYIQSLNKRPDEKVVKEPEKAMQSKQVKSEIEPQNEADIGKPVTDLDIMKALSSPTE